MSKSLPILIGVAVLIMAVGAIYLAAHRPPQTPAEQAAASVPKADTTAKSQAVSVSGAQIEQKDPAGNVEWKVTAGGELQFDKERQVAIGKDVKFQLMQAGKTPVTVSAPVFEANYIKKKLTFTQGVSGLMTDDSSRFNVNRMEYDFATRKLLGSGGAKFVQGQYVATAQEIVVDVAHKKVRLRGGVKFARNG